MRDGEHPFLRCVGVTEEAFMNLAPSLDDSCWFENARFDLAHRYRPPASATAFDALSPPARLGGRIAHLLAPAWSAPMEMLLSDADELPATGQWHTAVSEADQRRK